MMVKGGKHAEAAPKKTATVCLNNWASRILSLFATQNTRFLLKKLIIPVGFYTIFNVGMRKQ